MEKHQMEKLVPRLAPSLPSPHTDKCTARSSLGHHLLGSIVELGVGVAVLEPVDEELKALCASHACHPVDVTQHAPSSSCHPALAPACRAPKMRARVRLRARG